jgi:hypothetical protein
MARYIDEEKFLDYLDLDSFGTQMEKWWSASRVFEKLCAIPTEDVAPVVHAMWEDGRCTNCHTDKPVVMASVVQGYMHQYQGRLNYCPNCGAKIEEEL